jgi:membrane protease YdiL (CAAX protease family)
VRPFHLVLFSTGALAAVGTAVLLQRRRELRPELGAGLLWPSAAALLAAAAVLAYRPCAPESFWLPMGLGLWTQAALAAAIWPAGAWCDRQAGRRSAGALADGRRAARTLLGVAGTVLLAGAISLALYDLMERSIAPSMKAQEANLRSSTAGLVLMASAAAVVEELIFRHGFFTTLQRAFGGFDRRGLLAAALSSALWALAHEGHTDPAWIKYAQIFPFGLAQCALLRFGGGIEGPIAAHVLFNVAVVAMTVYGG